MGFGGSVLAMIQSLRMNARPKHRVYEEFEKADKRVFHTHGELVDKKVAPEELERIKRLNKQKIEKEQKRNLIFLAISVVVLIPLIALAGFEFFFRESPINTLEQQTVTEDPVTEQINYLLNSGYEWLNKNHYKNARFQFNRVLEVQPNNQSANYGLAATYVYECKIDSTNCEKASKMLNEYISKNGANSSTDYLKEMLEE